MNSLRNFFSSKLSIPAVANRSDIELDGELYLTIARQLGKENESIRNLLIDAENKIKELGAIKRLIGEQVDPVSKTLHALETTKGELGAAETKVATLESDCAQLRETLSATQKRLATLEFAHGEQTKGLSTCRAQIAELKDRVQKQSGEIKVANDENRRLNERVTVADKLKVQLESEGAATRQRLEVTQQKLTASEDNRIALQKSLDKALTDLSQMSQRLREVDKALEDAKQKYDSDIALHVESYEALKTRAELTNKLLEDTRKSMLERAKEIQSSIAA